MPLGAARCSDPVEFEWPWSFERSEYRAPAALQPEPPTGAHLGSRTPLPCATR